MRTWIKICGTTCLEDALLSIEAGADALGFIFASSKRRITPEVAQEIISKLPGGVERIGVFLDASLREIHSILGQVDITGIQLHGNGSASQIRSSLPPGLREPLRIIKTILVNEHFAHTDGEAMNASGVDAWLLDSGAGSGQTFDWRFARERLGRRKGPFIIAGGLNAENVGEAISIFNPWGVDVVSGVEREPGRKDPEKLKAFVAAVRQAEKKELEKA